MQSDEHSPSTIVDPASCRAQFIGNVGLMAPAMTWSQEENEAKLKRSAEARAAWRAAHPMRDYQ